MSRFVALMEEHSEPLNVDVVRSLMADMLKRLDAVDGTIELRFPFFIRKCAPVSKLTSLMNYEAAWIADSRGGVITVRQETATPVTSLCPCSKEISRYGAHNQRSRLTASVELSAPMSLEEQIAYSEEAASCQLWARLKRSDEKYVTEFAYDHPKFVEDIVRDIGARDAFLSVHGFDGVPEGYEVHHVVPLSEGGADTPDNMILVSEADHAAITSAHAGFYGWRD